MADTGCTTSKPMRQQALHGMGNGCPGLLPRIDQVLVSVS